MLKGWIKKIIRETVETAKREAVARAKKELEITFSVEKIIADEVKKYVKAEIERVSVDLLKYENSVNCSRRLYDDLKRYFEHERKYYASGQKSDIPISVSRLIAVKLFMAKSDLSLDIERSVSTAIENASLEKANAALVEKIKSPQFIEDLISNINRFQVNNTGGV